ncbi:unnamed protein product [Nezara viridula]|uniref:SANT and BTB domain-containing protein n=1 Tax=Nezara viridula TaxID=85310 RepID=A0A9P0H2M6_NEZVI|nr:unnamed protein product [Nezara viridula]
MEYFAEVTEGQKLEDMDISVHCDVAIFEWLMKWVHRPLKGTRPVLSINNVTPILISAMFLRMEPLVDESVHFFKKNIKEIIETTTSLSCLSDNILEKIADTLTNVELDSLDDPTDKIQSKLFTKFIISLGKRKIDKRKGHYSSLASLYRCFYCKQILHEEHGQSLPCISDLLAIDSFGDIRGRHKEDTSWNLNSYMKQLKRELNTWQNVYWKLWGTCHYLHCVKCKMNYPVVSSMNCRYHPNAAHFGARSDSSNLLIPVGNYVCCGAKTYRFDVLGLPNGCMVKSHVPLENENTSLLVSILESKRRIIFDSSQVLCAQEKKIEEVKEMHGTMVGCSSTWRPLSRGNYIDKVYSFNDILNALDERESDGDIEYDANCTRSPIDDMDNASSESEFNDIASIGDGEDTDGSSSSKKYSPQNKSENNTKLWTMHRSIRFNQDNQREREEKIIKCIINKLNRSKNDSEFDIFLANNGYDPYHSSDGGVYAFLEEEWRDETVQPELNNPCFAPSRSPKPRTTKYTYN